METSATDRGWCAILALAAVAFAAYVTFVPFRFAAPAAGTSLFGFLTQPIELGNVSRGNGLANVVLFVPIGFFGLGALADQRWRGERWIAAAVVVAIVSACVSLVIETLQVFVPGRTPSAVDVVAQGIGTAFGLALWPVLGGRLRSLRAQFQSREKTFIGQALTIYSVVLAIYLLLPMDVTVDLGALAGKYRAGRIVFNPLASPSLGWEHVPGLAADFVMAAPVGVLALVGWRAAGHQRRWTALVLVTLFFFSAELAQIFVRSRSADVVDFLANCLGGGAGVLVAYGVGVAMRTGRIASAAPMLAAVLVLICAIHIVYNWSPFDFDWTHAAIPARAARLLSLPFASYYENPEFKALSDATVKLCLAAPLGVLLQLLTAGPDTRRAGRTRPAIIVGVTLAFFVIVESGQVLLPSRYPDSTDIILAVAGVIAGMMVARRFQSAPPTLVSERPVAPSAATRRESVLVLRTPSGGEIRRRRRRHGDDQRHHR